MTTRRRGQGPGLRKSRYERGVELKRSQVSLGSLLIAVDIQMRAVNNNIDRAVERCQPRGSGSIVGSTVQSSDTSPAHEDAFDWLESVRKTLADLNIEAPR